MKLRILLLTGVLLLTLLPAFAAEPASPNIIVILADDMGWMDAGFTGSKFIETPNLDRLAKQGMVFSSAYAGGANCQPSRACLLSGQYTPRHGVYAVASTDRGPDALKRLTPVPNRNGLARDVVTLAEALKAAGYTTGHFGKWHLMDKKDGAMPSVQGFDVTYDSFGNGPVPEGSEGNLTGPPADPKGVFTLTRKACDFIEANKSKPFFCYLAHHAPHAPLQAQPDTLKKFRDKKTPDAQCSALYAGCIHDLDASVGELLAKLDALNLTTNTLLVFTSDNGATAASSQEPLRGNKGGYYEGGIREPMIVCWPGVTRPGSTCDVPVINVDFYPTFLEAAASAPPKGVPLDGESLVPLLKGGAKLKRDAIFWHFPGYLDTPVTRGRDPVFRTRPVTVIRKGDWKLHLYHEEWLLDGGRAALATNNAVEVYNLAADLGERENLANKNIAKRDELLDDLLNWQKAIKAPMPTLRSTNAAPEKPGRAIRNNRPQAAPLEH